MPVTLPAQYRAAQAQLMAARLLDDRKAVLAELLATLPRHESTTRVRAELKRHLARLRNELARRASKKSHQVHVDPEGVAQVLLLGAPNVGKSSLLGLLTRAEPSIADYPFSTTRPQAGLTRFEDVMLQLVDLPAVTAQHIDPWMQSLAQGADAALLVADPSAPEVLAGIEDVCDRFTALDLPLVGALPDGSPDQVMPLPTLLVINKTDLVDEGEIEVLEELYHDRYTCVRCSVRQRIGVQALKLALWCLLQLVRVYLRKPGKSRERSEAMVLPAGSSVSDLVMRVSPEKAERLAAARVWGGKIQGQRVGRDFLLRDRDEVELAF
jgi:ribosome-interacting GTPase 1